MCTFLCTQSIFHGFPIRQIHSDENQGGAEKEVNRDGFVEQQPRENNRRERIDIDVVRRRDGADLLHRPVPHDETEHRGDKAEKEQIGEDFGLQQERHRRHFFWHENVIGNHRQQAVEKHFPRDENHVVAAVCANHQQAINRPTKAGEKRQRVANRREMEHEMAVEHDNDDSDGCQHRAEHLRRTQSLRLIKTTDERSGEKRSQADDERGVGRGRVVHRLVFGEKIQRTARNAEPDHQQFVFPVVCQPPKTSFLPLGKRKRQEQHVGNDESQGENLGRRQSGNQQQLRIDKSAAPDDDRQESRDVTQDFPIQLHKSEISTAKVQQYFEK